MQICLDDEQFGVNNDLQKTKVSLRTCSHKDVPWKYGVNSQKN